MNYIQNTLLNTLVFIKDKLEAHDQELQNRKKIFAISKSNTEPVSQAAKNAEEWNKSTGSSDESIKDKLDLT